MYGSVLIDIVCNIKYLHDMSITLKYATLVIITIQMRIFNF